MQPGGNDSVAGSGVSGTSAAPRLPSGGLSFREVSGPPAATARTCTLCPAGCRIFMLPPASTSGRLETGSRTWVMTWADWWACRGRAACGALALEAGRQPPATASWAACHACPPPPSWPSSSRWGHAAGSLVRSHASLQPTGRVGGERCLLCSSAMGAGLKMFKRAPGGPVGACAYRMLPLAYGRLIRKAAASGSMCNLHLHGCLTL